MATLYVDGKPYEVKAGNNLLRTCLSLGFDIPYFCWHPALGSVGACRQCAVKQFKDESDIQGAIVMSCMTPVTDGLRISIDDPEVREFRAGVIEWLMVNHPHDCPVCDEGGECHLQDMTVMTGHTHREYRFTKRTHRNQDLGPFVNHEMNRCIACYRCVRFYREYAGGRDLDVFGAHDQVYFGRFEDGVLESEFSGNLVEICPTGVFTDKTLKEHYTRKWDLQTAPSICVHCGLGCNTIPGERYGQLRRIRNRYNDEVNGYFLCDRGRYGYEFVNSVHRIRQPLVRKRRGSDAVEPASKIEALEHLVPFLSKRDRVIGIGSPRATLEANFALRTLVGPGRFYAGVSKAESRLVPLALQIAREGPARLPSLHDVQLSDAVLVLGEDVLNTAPMLALALHQSVRQIPMHVAERLLHIHEWQEAAVEEAIQLEEGPLIVATPGGTKLDRIATRTVHAAPDDLARLGFAVAHALNPKVPSSSDLPEEMQELAREIAQSLETGERPLVVSGTGCGSEAVVRAAANIAWALYEDNRRAALWLNVPECNSLGLGWMEGRDLQAAFRAVRDGAVDTVVILENDLYRRADTATVDAFLDAAEHVIVVDHLSHATTKKADVVLPAATFAETTGTLVNSEGRAQRSYQVFVPDGEVQASWRWLRDLSAILQDPEGSAWQCVDDVVAALVEQVPSFEPILAMTPSSTFRIVGQKIPRQAHRYTGRTAMHADANVHEPQPAQDPDSPLAFSMEGHEAQPPSALIPRYWAPNWNSVQSLNKFQSEVHGPLRGGDPGRRLIEPAKMEEITYLDGIPPAFRPREREWLVVPLYHVFGSEELSMLTPGIAELAPEPYLAMNPRDAGLLQVEEGDEIDLCLDGVVHRLGVRFASSMPDATVGLSVGLPGVPGVDLPAWGTISRESST